MMMTAACSQCGCNCGGKPVEAKEVMVQVNSEDLGSIGIGVQTEGNYDESFLSKGTPLENEEGRLKCEICNRVFHYATSFARHLVLHVEDQQMTGEKSRSMLVNNESESTGCVKNGSDESFELNLDGVLPVGEDDGSDFEKEKLRSNSTKKKKKKLPKPIIERGPITTSEIYTCDLCGREFSSLKWLTRHHTSGAHSKTRFPCNVCHKSFASRSGRDYHKESHNMVKPTFPCEICQKTFSAKQSLKEHRRIHDPDAKELVNCNLCNKQFPSRGRMNLHIRSRHAAPTSDDVECGPLFTCETCGKTCKNRHILEAHQLRHTGNKTFICEVCGKAFYTAEELRGHRRGTHSNERNYKCDKCHRAFKTRMSLRTHAMTHTGEKPYRCEFCGRGFIQKNSMLIHRRTHVGERIFKCDTCEKSYFDAWSLREHKNTHLNSRPFKCSECNATFNRYGAMHAHRRVKHGMLGKRKMGVDAAALAGGRSTPNEDVEKEDTFLVGDSKVVDPPAPPMEGSILEPNGTESDPAASPMSFALPALISNEVAYSHFLQHPPPLRPVFASNSHTPFQDSVPSMFPGGYQTPSLPWDRQPHPKHS